MNFGQQPDERELKIASDFSALQRIARSSLQGDAPDLTRFYLDTALTPRTELF
jgi:hypothetical protein